MSYLDVYQTIPVSGKLAKATNPTVALYFATLLEVYEQVRRKRTFDPSSGFFKLDRAYMSERTGISNDEQRNCDLIMVALGVMKIDSSSKDKLAIDMRRYVEILADESKLPEELLPKTLKKTKADKQASKESAIKNMLVGVYPGFDGAGEEEREAIRTLVDVYYSKGVVKRAQWEQIFRLIKSAAKDASAVKEMTDYILATNYASIPAAIDSFMRRRMQYGTKIGAEQKKSNGAFMSESF